MTRKLEPMDGVKELGAASVPFEFDVHAMIPSDDAPALENELHTVFNDLRLNQVNRRKEFFRIPLERIRDFVPDRKIEATFTMLADANQFRGSQAIAKMCQAEREQYCVPIRSQFKVPLGVFFCCNFWPKRPPTKLAAIESMQSHVPESLRPQTKHKDL